MLAQGPSNHMSHRCQRRLRPRSCPRTTRGWRPPAPSPAAPAAPRSPPPASPRGPWRPRPRSCAGMIACEDHHQLLSLAAAAGHTAFTSYKNARAQRAMSGSQPLPPNRSHERATCAQSHWWRSRTRSRLSSCRVARSLGPWSQRCVERPRRGAQHHDQPHQCS